MTSHSDLPALRSSPTEAQLRSRIALGVVYAAARFAPLPFVDGIVRDRVTRAVVRSAAGTETADAVLAPLTSSGGCLSGCLAELAFAPIKLILFPLIKVLALAMHVKWVGKDMAEMVLLGRAVDHARAVGLLSGEAGPRNAEAVRRAFQRAVAQTDLRLWSALIGNALGNVRELYDAARQRLLAIRTAPQPQDIAKAADPSTDPALEASVGRIERLLASPDARAVLQSFDARFLAALSASSGALTRP